MRAPVAEPLLAAVQATECAAALEAMRLLHLELAPVALSLEEIKTLVRAQPVRIFRF